MNATTQEATPYARRDSATAALRKLGIDKTDYHRFIDPLTDADGTIYVVDVDAAKAHLKRKAAKPAQTEAAKVEAVARVAPSIAKRDAAKRGSVASSKASTTTHAMSKALKSKSIVNKRTVSSVARGLIADGKTNDDVWKILKAEFKLDDAKKGYPAWYRAEMKRKGLLKG